MDRGSSEEIQAVEAKCSWEGDGYRPASAPVKDSMGYGTWVSAQNYEMKTCSFMSNQPEGRIFNMSGTVSYYCDTTADGPKDYGPYEWRGQCVIDKDLNVTIGDFVVENCVRK